MKKKAIEVKGTHPTAHRVFVRFSGEEKDVVWITDGQEADDFYGATVSLPVESIDALVAALHYFRGEALK